MQVHRPAWPDKTSEWAFTVIGGPWAGTRLAWDRAGMVLGREAVGAAMFRGDQADADHPDVHPDADAHPDADTHHPVTDAEPDGTVTQTPVAVPWHGTATGSACQRWDRGSLPASAAAPTAAAPSSW